MRPVFNLLLLLAVSLPVAAQEQAAEVIAEAPKSSGSFLMNTVIIVFIVAALILLAVAFVLLRTFNVLAKELSNPQPFVVPVPVEKLDYEDWQALQKNKPSLLSKLLSLRPLEEEKDLVMEHKFDGIEELDNPTPPWFMWLFYGTIIFGVAYFLNYHVFKWGLLQDQEYVVEVQQAEAAKAEYLANAANLIDENSVTVSTEPAVISAGMALFNTNCVACHGDKGQGTVGPNLTDEYWLHGGSVNNVFKTIKYGIPEKGMISWEKQLTPKQISEVSNYILSLKGTNPPGAKEPQGEKEG